MTSYIIGIILFVLLSIVAAARYVFVLIFGGSKKETSYHCLWNDLPVAKSSYRKFLKAFDEQEWERGYPSRRGPAYKIADYMRGDKSNISPIMTNSESIRQFGNNAYGKPATALNILRETIMGRELFDFAFKTYCERWKFKHPTPADFFRTMEDASAVDLDWFWRGWFFSTDHVDIALSNVKLFQLNTQNPEIEKVFLKDQNSNRDIHIGDSKNKESIKSTINERDTLIDDFYGKRDIYKVDALDLKEYESLKQRLDDGKINSLNAGHFFYELTFDNIGGLVMPLIIKISYLDNTSEVVRIPAEVWRAKENVVTKVLILNKEVASFQLDPFLETADTDLQNNAWPKKMLPSRYDLFQERKMRMQQRENPMQRQIRVDQLKN